METTTVEKICDLTPVPFESTKPKLTNGQKALLALLNKGIVEKKAITRDDIRDLYISVSRYSDGTIWEEYTEEYITPENTTAYRWRRRQVPLDLNKRGHKHVVTTGSIMWFKSNLGSCILKGKLLAIPVIEIE